MKSKPGLLLFLIVLFTAQPAVFCQYANDLSQSMAATVLTDWKDGLSHDPNRPPRWAYEQGVLLNGMTGLWKNTADGKYFAYIHHLTDRFIDDNGTIRTYQADEFNLDNVLSGRNLLLLYAVTGQEKYRKAATQLRDQLTKQPRNAEGGFWHKKIYPDQMWLDGLYMAEPFYAEYAQTFHEDADFDDIAKQFILAESHMRDAKTGLLYHGWDASKKQRWADPATGHSPEFWGRAMGWYAMALVDTLDYFPENHPKRPELVAILNRLSDSIARYQDRDTGLWYQVLDKRGESGNYPESSASAMFIYSVAKGVRMGYLPARFAGVAQKGFDGLIKQFVIHKPEGRVDFAGTVSVAGLGGNPYRDGSYKYYIGEKVVTNDPKGVGAFLLASTEIARTNQTLGNGKTVLLDCFYNSEKKKDATGNTVQWHYKWDEMPNSGFAFFGYAFRNLGARTESLYKAPTAADLKQASVYIIVDPDTKEENDNPNFIEAPAIKAISDWVRQGGVLLLMGNDLGNAEFDHFNNLAKEFGIQFNKDSINHVEGSHFEQGQVIVSEANSIFAAGQKFYLKEISTLALTSPAVPLMSHKGSIIMATSKVGKGSVFAVGDPWVYNEYTDGRKLPPDYQNYDAAKELANWALSQASKRSTR